MVFSRSDIEFSTRMPIDNRTIERIEEVNLVGVWISTWLDWQKNTSERLMQG